MFSICHKLEAFRWPPIWELLHLHQIGYFFSNVYRLQIRPPGPSYSCLSFSSPSSLAVNFSGFDPFSDDLVSAFKQNQTWLKTKEKKKKDENSEKKKKRRDDYKKLSTYFIICSIIKKNTEILKLLTLSSFMRKR